MEKKIKTIRIYSIEPENEESDQLVKRISAYSEYDEAGNETLEIDYLPDGSVENKVKRTFNQKNELIEEINYIDEESYAEKKSIQRNESGQIEKIISVFGDDSKSLFEYARNDEEKTLSIIETDEEGELENKEIRKFNQEELLAEREVYDFNNKLTAVHQYEYNSQKQVVKRLELDRKRKVVQQVVNEYNDKGQLIKSLVLNRKNKLIDFTKWEYNEKGLLLEQNLGNKFFIKYHYDSKGNTEKETRENAAGIIERETHYTYNEDKQVLSSKELGSEKVYEYEYYS